MISIVFKKSSSVSPGNPTIKSEEKVISGLAFLSFLITDLYSNTVYPLFIDARTLSEPLCTGKCK